MPSYWPISSNGLRRGRRHRRPSGSTSKNVDFYINTYLLYEDAIPANEGAGHISMFFGDGFPRKAMWAGRSSIKANAASLKKF